MHPQFVESSVTFVMAAMMLAHAMARSDRSRVSRAVVALMVSLMIWTGCVALSRIDADPSRALVFAASAMLGAFFVPPIWIWITATSTRRMRLDRAGRWPLLVFVPSCAVCLLLLSNSQHGLVIAHWDELLDGSGKAWAGAAFWPWISWAYGLVVLSSLLLFRESTQFFLGRAPKRGLVLVAAGTLPLLTSISHTFGVARGDYDRTPMLLGFSILLLYVADWRFRLLDTMPIARRDVIDELQDGVVVADAEGLIVHMNPAAQKMAEVKLADVIGQSLVSVVVTQSEGRADIDEDGFMQVVRRMCAGPSGFETQLENYRGGVFEIRGASVGGEGDDVAGFYIILRDRTAPVRYESVLRQSRRSEAVASLAGGIAHEVNNPLAYVRSNVAHLLGDFSKLRGAAEGEAADGASEMRDILEETLEGVDRIVDIVDRVLRLSTREPAPNGHVDVNALVEDAIRVRGLDTDPCSSLDLELELGEGLPTVIGSRDRLLRCVVEVLENAQRAVGSGNGRISIRTLESQGSLVIAIGDDGPGIEPELRERVFDPFFTAASGSAGSGLGLAMAAQVASESGGGMEIVESEWGGAEVMIRLPAHRG